jgi:hypothetical protein
MKRNRAGRFTVLGAVSGDAGRTVLMVLRRTLRMPGHPVAALMWLSAVVCSGVAPAAAIFGMPGWPTLAVLAGLLWVNALAGRIFEAAYQAWDTRRRMASARWGSGAGWRLGRPAYDDRQSMLLRPGTTESWPAPRRDLRKAS